MVDIRQFQPADKDALVQLWQDVFPDSPAYNAPEKMLADKLLIDNLIFVAQSNRGGEEQKIVGACMVGYDGHRGWLYSVAVLPDHRRRGIGEQLVLHSIDALRKLGCTKINLQIRAENKSVADFYVSLGFGVEDRLSMGLLVE